VTQKGKGRGILKIEKQPRRKWKAGGSPGPVSVIPDDAGPISTPNKHGKRSKYVRVGKGIGRKTRSEENGEFNQHSLAEPRKTHRQLLGGKGERKEGRETTLR